MAKRGFFSGLSERLGDIISSKPAVDDDMLEELTDELIMADIGVDTRRRPHLHDQCPRGQTLPGVRAVPPPKRRRG